ncbi:hypothetical protein AN652_05490 [Xanthomonas arboricola pv. pruni]|nr:hypothetical protein AKJ12_17575 [Xanthomonas arboricola pv. juglandis]KCX01188.1 hypothetical protein DK27_12740 [Xanthomonas arboricola pv. pruni]KOA99027.1 hypothetical protein AE920_13660 [Xanthomonas arboricola]PPU10212.1 hypothetical protein XacyCFBP2565_19910 [Xanthomonas arboricola pv. corylina]KOB02264.1 hypothetical protein AE921_06100 [Xanthomonas arboricola]
MTCLEGRHVITARYGMAGAVNQEPRLGTAWAAGQTLGIDSAAPTFTTFEWIDILHGSKASEAATASLECGFGIARQSPCPHPVIRTAMCGRIE